MYIKSSNVTRVGIRPFKNTPKIRIPPPHVNKTPELRFIGKCETIKHLSQTFWEKCETIKHPAGGEIFEKSVPFLTVFPCKIAILRFKIAKVYVFGAISHCKMMVLVATGAKNCNFGLINTDSTRGNCAEVAIFLHFSTLKIDFVRENAPEARKKCDFRSKNTIL